MRKYFCRHLHSSLISMVTHGKPQLYENMFIIQAAGKGSTVTE
jgi:hypothetical protein